MVQKDAYTVIIRKLSGKILLVRNLQKTISFVGVLSSYVGTKTALNQFINLWAFDERPVKPLGYGFTVLCCRCLDRDWV